jgi:hypothetical protein
MKRCAILIILCVLFGCTPSVVRVPVNACPPPPPITMPELAVDRLPDKPTTEASLRALMEDHIVLRNTLRQAITALDTYKK